MLCSTHSTDIFVIETVLLPISHFVDVRDQEHNTLNWVFKPLSSQAVNPKHNNNHRHFEALCMTSPVMNISTANTRANDMTPTEILQPPCLFYLPVIPTSPHLCSTLREQGKKNC